MASDTLTRVLAATREILLDFDGPVTPLFPGCTGADLAEDARHVLAVAGIDLPQPIAKTTDHLSVLRYGAQLGQPGVLDRLEEVCLSGELAAARHAQPTPGAHATLEAAQLAGRPVIIVSNNSSNAIDAYLERNQVGALVRSVVGRPRGRPELMKPNVYPIHQALGTLDATPESCVFIGDSVTDIEVSHATHVQSIGYSKNTGRGRELAAAGADAITEDMRHVADAIAAS